jgi:hypothetical protein
MVAAVMAIPANALVVDFDRETPLGFLLSQV